MDRIVAISLQFKSIALVYVFGLTLHSECSIIFYRSCSVRSEAAGYKVATAVDDHNVEFVH